jgi:hypothetical protein
MTTNVRWPTGDQGNLLWFHRASLTFPKRALKPLISQVQQREQSIDRKALKGRPGAVDALEELK